MSREFWTFARVTILTAGYTAGVRTKEIAAAIGCGCTRCMVIGKANRMGLTMTKSQRTKNMSEGQAASGHSHNRKKRAV